MSTNAAHNLRPVTSFRWLFVLFGVATLGVVDGVLALLASIFSKGDGRGLLALIGVLSAIAGLVLIKKPFDTLVVFTLIIGVWFVVAGVVRCVAAAIAGGARARLGFAAMPSS